MTQPNAVAGPSYAGLSSAQSASSATTTAVGVGAAGMNGPVLAAYLAPDPAPTRPRSIIHPTHDLLGRFGILPVYDEFVRPFTTSAPGTIEDKGKRKEDGEVQDDARHGPKEGLFQHGYKHFIKDLGLGKHNHKKDTFLSDLMLNPEKQAVPIAKLDRTTLVHAFRLKEGGVPGFNASALTGDDKERKKKKKKRPIDPSQPSAPATPGVGQPVQPSAAGTPNPAIRRPTGPLPPSQLASSHVPPTQQAPAQRPAQPPQRHPLPANPNLKAAAARPPGVGPVGAGATAKRKDREDGVNGHVGGGMGASGGGTVGGTGLKPAKKRKMDPMAFAPGHHHHAQQVVQQPTPHY